MARVEIEEKSTLPVVVDVTDENDDPVVPVAFNWILSESDGTLIDSGSETPAASVTVYLAGTQLAITDATKAKEKKILTIKTDMGDALKPQNKEYEFWVKNLVNVS